MILHSLQSERGVRLSRRPESRQRTNIAFSINRRAAAAQRSFVLLDQQQQHWSSSTVCALLWLCVFVCERAGDTHAHDLDITTAYQFSLV